MLEQSYKQNLMDELSLAVQVERIKAKASMNRVANPKDPAPKVEEFTQANIDKYNSIPLIQGDKRYIFNPEWGKIS